MSSKQLLSRVIILVVASRCCVSAVLPPFLPVPSGINFIGIGYDIIEGNPEGGDLATGGVDPGLKVSRKIFKLTYDEGKTSNDGLYKIPDQTSFIHRSSSYTIASQYTFHGTKSYTNKLALVVSETGKNKGMFATTRFGSSSRYEQFATRTETEGYVYYSTETVENLGHARYLTELAVHDEYDLERTFVADACRLPNIYEENVYMNFIQDWGTHLVIEMDLGARNGVNYEEQRSSFVQYAHAKVSNSVTRQAGIRGYSSSLAVDMETFNSGFSAEMEFGVEASSYQVGSADLNEPISLTLMTMNDVFVEDYWTGLPLHIDDGLCSRSWNLTAVADNVLQGLQGYSEWLQIPESSDDTNIDWCEVMGSEGNCERQDPVVDMPLTWPDGLYGLPKPNTGCPNSHFYWSEGDRYQDTEDKGSNNYWSSSLHLAGNWAQDNILRYFCVKTTSVVDEYSWSWPPGTYCIHRRGGSCPQGFVYGYIYWDDEDKGNANYKHGTLPDGNYDSNTRIYYCCRSDGATTNSIFLPTDNNFYLLPRYSSHCQEVDGMYATSEYFRWDNEDKDNADYQYSQPYYGRESGGENVKLYYCYYRPSE